SSTETPISSSTRRKTAVSCLLPTASCRLPTAYCLLPTAYCLLPTAYCLLPTAHCPLPTAYCLLPTAYCLLPTAHCLLLLCCLLDHCQELERPVVANAEQRIEDQAEEAARTGHHNLLRLAIGANQARNTVLAQGVYGLALGRGKRIGRLQQVGHRPQHRPQVLIKDGGVVGVPIARQAAHKIGGASQ